MATPRSVPVTTPTGELPDGAIIKQLTGGVPIAARVLDTTGWRKVWSSNASAGGSR